MRFTPKGIRSQGGRSEISVVLTPGQHYSISAGLTLPLPVTVYAIDPRHARDLRAEFGASDPVQGAILNPGLYVEQAGGPSVEVPVVRPEPVRGPSTRPGYIACMLAGDPAGIPVLMRTEYDLFRRYTVASSAWSGADAIVAPWRRYLEIGAGPGVAVEGLSALRFDEVINESSHFEFIVMPNTDLGHLARLTGNRGFVVGVADNPLKR